MALIQLRNRTSVNKEKKRFVLVERFTVQQRTTQLIKTTVNISCGLLNDILTLFIFLLRFLYVTLSYK